MNTFDKFPRNITFKKKDLNERLFNEFMRYFIMKDIRRSIIDYLLGKYDLAGRKTVDTISRILFFKGQENCFFPDKTDSWIPSTLLKLRYLTGIDNETPLLRDIDFIRNAFYEALEKKNVSFIHDKVEELYKDRGELTVRHERMKDTHYLTNNIAPIIKFSIHEELYRKLYSTSVFEKDDIKERKQLIFLTLLRYEILLDSKNHQLGIQYHVENIHTYDVELFASPINRTLDSFCSAYYDVDGFYKGSLGSFFQYTLESNKKYTMNPPYDDPLMTAASQRILDQLRRKDLNNIYIYITIPIWDVPILRALGLGKDIPSDIKEAEYKPYVLLRDSGFVDKIVVSTSNEYAYYNHYKNKIVRVAHTFTIFLEKN